MPHIFTQVPFPKASLAILEAFATLAGIELDLTELTEQSRGRAATGRDPRSSRTAVWARPGPTEEEGTSEKVPEPETVEQGAEPETPSPHPPKARKRIEELFESAARDRSKAFELKQEFDRLGLFAQYEDRFLDQFKKPE